VRRIVRSRDCNYSPVSDDGKDFDMQPRYYDASGHIDHDAVKAYASELRSEAIDAFWSELSARVGVVFARWRGKAAAHVGASAMAHPRHLPLSRHRSG
jgi:hypothetical protein